MSNKSDSTSQRHDTDRPSRLSDQVEDTVVLNNQSTGQDDDLRRVTLNDDRPASCPRLSQITGLLNDLLEVEESEQVANHIEDCRPCQKLLERLTAAESSDDDSGQSQPTSPHPATHLSEVLNELKDAGMPNAKVKVFEAESNEHAIRFPGPVSVDAPLGRLGGYQIQAEIGSGSTGLLFRAHDPRLGRNVAIKVLRNELAIAPRARTRFEQEARAVARLNHKHVVKVHDVGSPPDFLPYMSMEFIDGEPLTTLVAKEECSTDQAVSLVQQILLGLSHAHENRVIHRDIKPSNVLVDKKNHVRLVDFGLARLDERCGELTAEHALAGTPAYMAPEQIVAPTRADEQCDVYSTGVVLFELLTGSTPFRGVTRVVLQQVLHDDPPSPRTLNDQVPRDLATVCLKAISRDPTRRYPSADAFHKDLERWRNNEPVEARPVSLADRLWRKIRRHPVISSLFAAIAILLCGIISLWIDFTLSVADANTRLQAGNVRLSQARDRAVRNQLAATSNADLAERQTNLAYGFVHEIVFEVQDQLKHDPSLNRVREALLSRAVVALERLSATVDDNAGPQVSLIVALNRMGDIWRDLNDKEAAVREYERAAKLTEKLQQTSVAPLAIKQCQMWTDYNLGAILLPSKPTESRTRLQNAITAASQLSQKARQHPDLALDARLHFINANRLLGNQAEAEGDSKQACAFLEAAMQNTAAPHDSVVIRTAQADARIQLARILFNADTQFERCHALLERAAIDYDASIESGINSDEARLRISLALTNLAELELRRSNRAAAASYNDRAGNLLKLIGDGRGPQPLSVIHALHHSIRGRIAALQSDSETALDALVQAEKYCQQTTISGETSLQTVEGWLTCQTGLAEIEERLDQDEAASVRYRTIKTTLQTVLASSKRNQHNRVSEMLDRLAATGRSRNLQH